MGGVNVLDRIRNLYIKGNLTVVFIKLENVLKNTYIKKKNINLLKKTTSYLTYLV